MYTTKFRYFTLPFPIDLPRINKSRLSNTEVQFLFWLTESRVFETSRNHSSPEFGVELNIKHIAHCEMAQVVLDRHELPWGTLPQFPRVRCRVKYQAHRPLRNGSGSPRST